MQREKNRRGSTRSSKRTGGTTRANTRTTSSRGVDPGKDGIINTKDGNKTTSSNTIQTPLNLQNKCGERKWLLTRGPNKWRKTS